MDKIRSVISPSSKSIKSIGSGNVSPQTYRFQVARVNSLAVGCARAVCGGNNINNSPDSSPSSSGKGSALGGVRGSGEISPYVTTYPLDYQPPSPTSSADTADLISPSSRGTNKTTTTTRRYSRSPGGGIPAEATSATNMAEKPPAQRKFSLAGILSRKRSSTLPQLEDFHQNQGTMGLYGKSLYRYTQDALPKMENYKDVMSIKAMQRPTIDELHEPSMRKKVGISRVIMNESGWGGCVVGGSCYCRGRVIRLTLYIGVRYLRFSHWLQEERMKLLHQVK
jgi:hypothetical protein